MGLGDMVIMSYVPFCPGQSKLMRLSYNWVNHFSSGELEEMLNEMGLAWTSTPTVEPGDTIYCLRSNTCSSDPRGVSRLQTHGPT